MCSFYMIRFIIECLKHRKRLECVLKIFNKGGRKCDLCNREHELFSVNDELWFENFNKNDFVCIGCFENKLGRKLNKSDLKDVPVNEF
jgi:hypothetical protein